MPGSRSIDSVESFEKVSERLLRDAYSCIGHVKNGLPVDSKVGNRDCAALGSVFDGVVDEIHDHLAQANGIGDDVNGIAAIEA
jgi:hypothetical protein